MAKLPSFLLNLLNPKAGNTIHDPIHEVTNLDLGSVHLDLDQCKLGLDVLERGSRIQLFSLMSDIGLDNTATFAELCAAFPAESILLTEAFTASFPNMDVNPTVAGNRLSGTLMISSARFAGQRLEFTFYSSEGVFRRRVETSASSAYQKDSGWSSMNNNGFQMEISAAMVTNLGGLLSNLRETGEYSINGTNMALFTDNPYNTAGVFTRLSSISIKRLMINRGVIQEVTGVFTYPVKMIRTIDSDSVISDWRVEFLSGTGFVSSAQFTAAGITSTSGFTAQGTSTFRHINPHVTATDNIGGASLTFNNLYLQNSPTIVSDRNHKSFINSIPDDVLDVWATINYSQWKMNAAIDEKGEEDARIHVGIIAQEIKEKFEAAGLDATKFGILIHEHWDAIERVDYNPAVYDPSTGELVSDEVQAVEGRPAGEIWMVRMEECFALEAALTRRTQIQLNKKLEELSAM